MAVKEQKDPLYWNTDKPPLLIQGFEVQVTNDFIPTPTDKKKFETRVNRGVVVYLDYQCLTLAQVANGLLESDFNASQITCIAGGQEILVNEPAERYDYAIDLGDRKEHKVPVIINGGQTVISTLELPDLTSNSATSPVMSAQLLLHYSTKQHTEWVKKYSHFGNGLGLKRRSYRLRVPGGTAADANLFLTGVIPKNQGRIIGFSFLYEGTQPIDNFINFKVDDLGLIENVAACRWSRYNQRDPYIQWIDLNPGSTFRLQMDNSLITNDVTNVWVTFYFDN